MVSCSQHSVDPSGSIVTMVASTIYTLARG